MRAKHFSSLVGNNFPLPDDLDPNKQERKRARGEPEHDSIKKIFGMLFDGIVCELQTITNPKLFHLSRAFKLHSKTCANSRSESVLNTNC